MRAEVLHLNTTSTVITGITTITIIAIIATITIITTAITKERTLQCLTRRPRRRGF